MNDEDRQAWIEFRDNYKPGWADDDQYKALAAFRAALAHRDKRVAELEAVVARAAARAAAWAAQIKHLIRRVTEEQEQSDER